MTLCAWYVPLHSSDQWTYHAIQNGGEEVVQFGQCLPPSRDCWIYSDNINYLMCKSVNLVSVPRGDQIKLYS